MSEFRIVSGRRFPGFVAAVFLIATISFAQDKIDIPVLDGNWWQIAENAPDVGEYNNPGKHNACDFTIWKAADGTWQLLACIRGTTFSPGERIFHRWETAGGLTNTLWTPKGVFAVPQTNPPVSQNFTLQAPHCFFYNDKYYLFYNSGYTNARGTRQGNKAYCKISTDGKNFENLKNTEDDYAFFTMGRDMMVFNDSKRNRFIAYFQNPTLPDEPKNKNGAMYFRTAPAPEGPWSKALTNIGNKGNPESPFVIEKNGKYYLWEQMSVFISDTPENFSDHPITKMTPGGSHGKYAPEILLVDGQYYIAGYAQGIWLAKFKWETKTMDEINAWRKSFGLTVE